MTEITEVKKFIVPLHGKSIAAPDAPPPNLQYGNGHLLTSVQVYTVFWGSAWQNPSPSPLIAQVNAFFDTILASSLVDLLGEYSVSGQSIGHGSRIGSATLTSSDPGGATKIVNDSDIQSALKGWIADGTIAATTGNTLYFVYLPSGITANDPQGDTSCNTICGYHWSISGTSPEVYYAVVPYPSCNGCLDTLSDIQALTTISSHELCESITDPHPFTGWNDSSNGEIGDICAWQLATINGFEVQKEWSNSQKACVIGPPPVVSVSDPVGYAFINDATGVVEQHNLFLSADGHVRAIWFNFAQGWHHEDRTALVAGVPAAVGDPVGYAFIDGASVEQHNLFRSADGHIHALWFNFAQGWHHEDRTALVAGVPAAVGDPFGYAFINDATGVVEQHNLFRSADGHIHALWFNFAQGWHHEDRSLFT